MTNREIAKQFQLLGKIMELHGENPFKIRSYSNAYLTLRKLDQPLTEVPASELEAIKGIGKAIAQRFAAEGLADEIADHGAADQADDVVEGAQQASEDDAAADQHGARGQAKDGD